MSRIQIGEDEPIEVSFTARERTLILDHAFADPQLTDRLTTAKERGGKVRAPFTLYDIEELCGCVAAEANHTEDKRLRRDLQELFARLSDLMERYDDGNWQASIRDPAAARGDRPNKPVQPTREKTARG